mmetsp:Transcript_13161/g.37509  ORF Transcript_13161/g.37509 Transcript_13161/m.37509 type:complete len:241 (+) Transcript_13161:1673-2395(+)
MVLALGLLWWWPPTPKPPPLSCCCCCCRPARPMAVPALLAAAAAAACRCWTAAVGNSSSSPRLSILRARRMRPHRLFLRRMRLMPSWSTIWSAVSLGAAPFLPFLPPLPLPLPLPLPSLLVPPPSKPPRPSIPTALPVILDRNENPPLTRACCNVKPGLDNLAMTARSILGSDLRPRCDRLVWRRMARADGERLMAAPPRPRPRLAEVKVEAAAEVEAADLEEEEDDLDLVREEEAEGRW